MNRRSFVVAGVAALVAGPAGVRAQGVVVCPKCGREAKPGEAACSHCGAALPPPKAAAPAAEPEAPKTDKAAEVVRLALATVAELLARLLETPVPGVVHGSCEGEATWFEFAQAIFARAGLSRGLVPCTTADFPRPAPRPANSRLEKRVLRLAGLPPMPHWEEALEKCVSSLVR